MYLRRRRNLDGLASTTIGPTSVPELAAVFDPDAPWVLLSNFEPLGDGWHQTRVPLLPSQAKDPAAATIRNLHFDVLLATSEFLALAPGWGESGLRARQLTKRPEDQFSFGTARNPPPAALLRAMGLVVAVDLAKPNDIALVLTTSVDALEAVLMRMGSTR